MTRQPCRFINKPGGCYRGNSCRYDHSLPPSSPSPASVHDKAVRGDPPSGVCSFYWKSGQCFREFGCRYKHVQPSTSLIDKQSGSRSASPAFDAVAPFLTEAGLAKVSRSGSDIYFSASSKQLSPNEAHNSLKRFLYDDFRFRKTFDIYAFLVPITSANPSNTLWTTEDGQLLLSSLAAGNGLLRIGDVIRWTPISMRAGSHPGTLSFQRGYLPLLRFFSSDIVVKSTLSHLVNALYMIILENLPQFTQSIQGCMQDIMSMGSFKDPANLSLAPPIGSQAIASLAGVLFECLTRVKNAVSVYPQLAVLVRDLESWTDRWVHGISSTPPTFDDPFKDTNQTAREHIISHIKNKISRLIAIIDREQNKADRIKQKTERMSSGTNEGIIAALQIEYEGPGELRPLGKRHDNDFVDINDVRIAPTHEELICHIPPFLPANLWDAPHPYPASDMQRLLDIQFRLLREELTAPLRTSVQLVRDDLMNSRAKTRLSDLVKNRGGKYRGFTGGQESIMFNVYTNVNFTALAPDHRGLSAGLSFDAPPGRARSTQTRTRVAFWEGIGGRRFMQGGLVALVWQNGADVDIHLGLVASPLKDLIDSAKQNVDRIAVRIVFFDSEVELRILHALQHPNEQQDGSRLLVEAPVMYEAIRPFLEALRVVPETLPFGKYLVHHPPGYLGSLPIEPPAYAKVPEFRYQLCYLFSRDADIQDLRLDVSDPVSISSARETLRRSRLDPSQADAVVDTLTREVSLIQGPPGTGKSFTGVEILRVLVANEIKPILMIAYTNHALDHMLCSVLDAGITSKIVRLGSRSADERISKYSMETLELVAGKSRLDRTFGRSHRTLKSIEEEIRALMKKFLQVRIESEEIAQYLQTEYPEHFEWILQPPRWVSAIKGLHDADTAGWQRTGKNNRVEAEDNSVYAYWKSGQDILFLQSRETIAAASATFEAPRQPPSASHNPFAVLEDADVDRVDVESDTSEEEFVDDSGIEDVPPEELWQFITSKELPGEDNETPTPAPESVIPSETAPSPPSPIIDASDFQDVSDFFSAFGCDHPPPIPSSDRYLDELLLYGNMWAMSLVERRKLDTFWSERARTSLHRSRVEDFQSLRKQHEKALREYMEGKDEARRQLLQNVDIVGCTTTGAAKLTTLLKGLDPRVMLVEEAGQVLEAHVLGSLVPSIEHLILIGDPLQLRPTLNNFALSMDSKRGSQIFKFDMSLMERLSESGFPMSQIDVQRRMRPSISNLVRTTLYPKLEDHDLVKKYSAVRGFAKDVFFLSHKHPENGSGDESASKYNTYEVEMVKDIVLYLLRQGCYSREGDIVVLCAYLGQLARVRDALATEVAIVIDERDQLDLADHEAEKDNMLESDPKVERVKISRRVRLRTIDNFQGEEAKIVILSLVRNGGSVDDDEPTGGASFLRRTIGFLKSENRTNVALSRAREGLLILGNADQLASRSRMWRDVLRELESQDAIGPGFPVACARHSENIEYISEPGRLAQIAPDGGCLRPCDTRLKCGHTCPYKCHPDDPNHISVECVQPCRKLCSREHPCHKQCADSCGDCDFPVMEVELPCGHICPSVPCHLMDNLEEVYCGQIVTKSLVGCEHVASMPCSVDVSQHTCRSPCKGILTCCGRDCQSLCFECQGLNVAASGNDNAMQPNRRIKHRQHPCSKTLHCAHRCTELCSQNHVCTSTCKETCRQECTHAKCNQYCSTPCSPCQEPCTWNCQHHYCPVPCGSICVRLPCDVRCNKILYCGHRCPSVCGEDCSIQICPSCAPASRREQVVDLILHRTLFDIDPDQETLDELLITLPKCRHVFTVETLDGHCGLSDYYAQDSSGNWVSLQSPDFSLQRKTPPVCPTCRTAITAARYGRVFKRADLDILERNVVSRMSQSLQKVQTVIDSFAKEQATRSLEEAAASITISASRYTAEHRKLQAKRRAALIKNDNDDPLPFDGLDPSHSKLHRVSSTVCSEWRKATKHLATAYQQACKIAKERSAHLNAWEAAFSCLYEQEMDQSVSDPAHAPRNPRQHALRMARMKVGQPQPRADRRFVVEAFWTTLKIRFLLAELAQVWLRATKRLDNSYPAEEQQSWATYTAFLLASCDHDSRTAFKIAQESESRRQMTTTQLFIMRAELERFRFNVDMTRHFEKFQENRQKLITVVEEKIILARQVEVLTQREHLAQLPNDRQEWLRTVFAETAKVIIEEWEKLRISIRSATFYSPVSLDEKMAIVRALNFSHTGHYYNCPNGHTFVITECGGASQISRCPECGAVIGGTGHSLESTNSRAMEFEEIARTQGAGASPWSWGV